MMKQLQLFLTQEDEAVLSRLLKDEFPQIRFINDNVWPEIPDCREGIEMCDTGRVYLYLGSLEHLPTLRRKTGDVEGPIAGCVIQVLRPREKDRVLLSGSIAAGINDQDGAMVEFVSRVWKCVNRIGKRGVVRLDGRVDKSYLVGNDARRCITDGVIKIVDRAVGLYYEPVA